MQPTNYTRQYNNQLREVLLRVATLSKSGYIPSDKDKAEFTEMVEMGALAHEGQKIMLPPGGNVMDGDPLKALDVTQKVRLPFPITVLEFENAKKNEPTPEGLYAYSKSIVVASERNFDGVDVIQINIAAYLTGPKVWSCMPRVYLEAANCIKHDEQGRVMFQLRADPTRVRENDVRGDVSALFSLLNFLSCSNTRLDKLPPQHQSSRKGALPFDTYHVLTVETRKTTNKAMASGGTAIDRNGPREHVRRGHIRRLENGTRVWVNACVVAAGSAKVTKDYAVGAINA